MKDEVPSFIPYLPPLLETEAVTESRQFLAKLITRRTVRDFSDEDFPREIVENAIKAAASAPSGANSQPWFFAIVKSAIIKERIRRAAEEVEEEFYTKKAPQRWLNDLAPLGTTAEKPYLTEAPYLIVVFSRYVTTASLELETKSYYPIESTGMAVGMLLASLHMSGLGTLTHTPKPMNFLNQVLGLDQSYRPYVIVVTGKAKEDALVPRLKKKNFDEIHGTY